MCSGDASARVGAVECDGGPYCQAPVHMHGCYADNGTNCDHPSEHQPRPSSGADTQALIERLQHWLPKDIREHHTGGDFGGCSCEAHDALDALGARVRELEARAETADEWLDGLERSWSSPAAECSQEDIDEQGNREGNTCLASAEYDDLEFPDEWCLRCYTLRVVREARAALACSRPELELEP